MNYLVTIGNPINIKKNNYDIISIKGSGYLVKPGAPLIPYKNVIIILPSKYTLDHVEVRALDMQLLPGNYFIIPAPAPFNRYMPNRAVAPDPEIYNRSDPYPNTIFYYKPKVYRLQGFKILIISLFPIQYIPSEGRVFFYKRFNITIYLKKDKPVLARSSIHIIDWLKHVSINPDTLYTYDVQYTSQDRYLIITRPLFSTAIDDLVDFLRRRGFTIYVEYVDDIINTYLGRDTPEKIRNCIKDYYWNYGIEYVLLFGDPDPSDLSTGYALDKNWEVPTRYVFNPDNDSGYDKYFTKLPNDYTPTDYYYAGLDGTWDADNDGYYGESEVYSSTGSDEVDWFPEVYVGRVPVRTVADAIDYVNKLINYFNTLPTRSKWMLLLGAHLYDTDPSYYTDGAWVCEKIKAIYPPEIPKTSLYENGGNLTYDNVTNHLNYDPILVHSTSHGSIDRLWLYWTNNWYVNVSTPDLVSGLGATWYAEACLSGAFDIDETLYGPSLSEALLRDPDGSSLVQISSTRISWMYIDDWYLYGLNGKLSWLFWYWLYRLSRTRTIPTPGKALYQSKIDYYIQFYNDVSSVEEHRKVLFAQILFGDPSLPVTVGLANISTGYNYEVGEKIIIQGSGFPSYTSINLYFEYEVPILPEGLVEIRRVHILSITANSNGEFYLAFHIPFNTSRGRVYDVILVDQYGNYAGAGEIYVRNTTLIVSPNVGYGGYMANIMGSGYSSYSTVHVYMNGTLIGEYIADQYGSFSGILTIPLADPGFYQILAVDDYGNTGYEVIRILSSYIPPVMITIDTGSIHFVGETAEFYILTSFNGSRIDVNSLTILLYHGNNLIANLTSSAIHIDKGLYKVNYTIPMNADEGICTLFVEALYDAGLFRAKGSSIKSFQISPTLTEWGAILTEIHGNVATIKTDIGYIKLMVDNINMTVYDIKNDTVYIKTKIGNIEADLNTLRSLIENVNSTLVSMINETHILIKALNTSIIVRLDLLNMTITSVKNDTVYIKTSLGYLEFKIGEIRDLLNRLNTTITSIQGDIANIKTDIGDIRIILTDMNMTIYDIEGDIVYLKTEIGNIKTSIETISDFLERMNATIIDLIRNTTAIIRAGNINISLRLDLLNASISDLILSSKSEILGKLDTVLGIILTKLNIIDAKIMEVHNDTVLIETILGNVRIQLDDIKTLIEEVNATILELNYDNLWALINISNSVVLARIDELNATISDLIISGKGEVLVELNTSIGRLLGRLDNIDSTLVGIKNYTAEIIRDVQEIGSIIKSWTGETVNLYGYNSLILTTSTITRKPEVTDYVIELATIGPNDTEGSLSIILPKIILEILELTINDITVLVDGDIAEFKAMEHETYYVIRLSYSPDKHVIIIHLKGMLDDDRDGIKNYEEYVKGMNPGNPDTDGDLFSDALDPWPLNSFLPITIIVIPIIIAVAALLITLRRRKRAIQT